MRHPSAFAADCHLTDEPTRELELGTHRAQPLTSGFSCTNAERAQVQTVLGRVVTVAELRRAVGTAVAQAQRDAMAASRALRARPRSIRTSRIFRSIFNIPPTFVPAWRPGNASWPDLGALVALRIENGSRILGGGYMHFFCWGSAARCPECTEPPTSYRACSSYQGRHHICLGREWWEWYRNGHRGFMASTLLHEAMHIYFRLEHHKATVARPSVNNIYRYDTLVAILSGRTPKPGDRDKCAAPEARERETSDAELAPSETWGHLWADWHPVFRDDQEEWETIPGSAAFGETGWPVDLAAQYGEDQPPPAKPTVTKTFSAEALAELPEALRAKPLVSIQATVPTGKIIWMIRDALANRGAEPGWADRLLVDLQDLPKAAPSATVHVAVFETVPFYPGDQAMLKAFHRFCLKAYAGRELPFDALTIGDYTLNRKLEESLDLPAGSLAQAAGLPTQMTANRAANYKLVVYAILPRGVGMVVSPRDQRALRGFPFDRATLTSGHEAMLDSLAREVVRSWYSSSIVTKVVIQGHTDAVGTREYNYALGRRRAEAVASRFKALINRHAGRLPAGTVERIQYVVESYGKDRPFSKRLNSLNRRVELTVYRDNTPPPRPLKLNETLSRLTSLLTSQTKLDADTVNRLRCLLSKLQQPGTDDRFATDFQVFLINRDNRLPEATDWARVLTRVLTPEVFGPQVPDDRVIAALGRLDLDIGEGIAKTNQIVAYANGISFGLGPLGLLALSNAFRKYNDWQFARLHDSSSVYSCYASIFL